MFCNRGIYHQGWTGVTRHSIPWDLVAAPTPYDDDTWELYGPDDWTQARDLAKENPAKLAELQRLWLIEAVKYSVLPLDDRRAERIIPEKAGRPTLIHGDSQLLFGGLGRLSVNSVSNTKYKSFAVTAEIEVPEAGAAGVIVAQGASIGGWSLYANEGKLKYCYNVCGVQHFFTEATSAIPSGKHQARVEFAYDGGGLGKGGAVSLFVDGNKVGEGRVELTQAMIFSADETLDVGVDDASPVSPDYQTKNNAFNGTVNWVQIDIGKDDHDHMISPDERFSVAMARQ
jgi:arylsulfatase